MAAGDKVVVDERCVELLLKGTDDELSCGNRGDVVITEDFRYILGSSFLYPEDLLFPRSSNTSSGDLVRYALHYTFYVLLGSPMQ